MFGTNKEYPLRQIAQQQRPRWKAARNSPSDEWLLALYNDGCHLYVMFPTKKPTHTPSHESLFWLRYRDFSMGGEINGVTIVHKGHSCTRRVFVDIILDGIEHKVKIAPHRAIWLRKNHRSFYLYIGIKQF